MKLKDIKASDMVLFVADPRNSPTYSSNENNLNTE